VLRVYGAAVWRCSSRPGPRLVCNACAASFQLPAVIAYMLMAGSVHVDVAGQSVGPHQPCRCGVVVDGIELHVCVVVAQEVLIAYPCDFFCALLVNKER
jgi:hypothetical protein